MRRFINWFKRIPHPFTSRWQSLKNSLTELSCAVRIGISRILEFDRTNDYIEFLKLELDYFKQENLRLSGLLVEKEGLETPEDEDDVQYKPVTGISLPSTRRAELERLHKLKKWELDKAKQA